jgi:ABC-type polysaccharide/polyol phosphate transport system ATPase subunit
VFPVAHNLAEIAETCNRIIWLEKGQIVKAGDDVPGILDEYPGGSRAGSPASGRPRRPAHYPSSCS